MHSMVCFSGEVAKSMQPAGGAVCAGKTVPLAPIFVVVVEMFDGNGKRIKLERLF